MSEIRKMQPKKEDERGAAMIAAIFAMLLGTALTTALYYSASSAMTVSVNDRDNSEALYIADAGITHAFALMNKVPRSKYSQVLAAGANTTPDTGDELSTPPVAGLWTNAENIPAGTATSGGVTNFGASGGGRYWVSVRNDTASGETTTVDNNGILIVTSTGVGRDGSTAIIESYIKSASAGFPGFLADGDVIISGPTTLSGPGGLMEINGNLTNSQQVCSELQILIGGTVSNINNTHTGSSCNTTGVLGSTVLTTQPRFIPPIIDQAKLRSDFRSKADYVFKPTGIYHQVNGVQDASPLTAAQITAASLGGFTWGSSAKTWSYSSSNRIPNGSYYYESCNVKITNGGSSTGGQLSLWSEGSISITNYPSFIPDDNYPGYAMVSANDIQVSSTLGTSATPALIYAYGQIEFTNQSTVLGGVIAANYYLPDGTNGPDALDPGGQNLVARSSKGTVRFSNTVNITTVDSFMSGPGAAILSWKEVRR